MTAGKVHHWKHGWIPVDSFAQAVKAGRIKPNGKIPPIPAGGVRPVVVPSSEKRVDLLTKMQTDGGFTYDPRTHGLIEPGKASGFVVAVPGTETVVGKEDPAKSEYVDRETFARAYGKLATKHKDLLDKGAVIGGWYSPDRNEFMLEISQIHDPKDREGAIQLGKDRNQEAIFDLSSGETIPTGGTGDLPATMALRTARPDLNPITEHSSVLTADEVAAVKYYTGPGFRPLNSALRFNNGQASLPVKARMRALDSAISKSRTVKPATVYRGVFTKGWLDAPQAPGTVLEDKGYMSTATETAGQYAGDTQMVIKVPAGHPALDLTNYDLTHHGNEKELLLARGTKLRVVSDVRTGSTRTIQAEAML